MAAPTHVSYSRTYSVPVEQAFHNVLAMPLEELFNRRYGPIPAIRGTDRAQPTWLAVGDARTIRLADGGSLHEELTRVDPPGAFGYQLTDVRGPMKPLAARIDGLWTFEPADGGTRITWSWDLHPRSVLSRAVLPVFAPIWRGSARRAFDRIQELLPVT